MLDPNINVHLALNRSRLIYLAWNKLPTDIEYIGGRVI